MHIVEYFCLPHQELNPTPRNALSVGPLVGPHPTIFAPSNAYAHHIIAWVTRPERPKDEVKLARRATN